MFANIRKVGADWLRVKNCCKMLISIFSVVAYSPCVFSMCIVVWTRSPNHTFIYWPQWWLDSSRYVYKALDKQVESKNQSRKWLKIDYFSVNNSQIQVSSNHLSITATRWIFISTKNKTDICHPSRSSCIISAIISHAHTWYLCVCGLCNLWSVASLVSLVSGISHL